MPEDPLPAGYVVEDALPAGYSIESTKQPVLRPDNRFTRRLTQQGPDEYGMYPMDEFGGSTDPTHPGNRLIEGVKSIFTEPGVENKAAGAHKVLGALGEAALPLAVPALALAPVPTVVGGLAAGGAGLAGKYGSKALGAGEGVSDLIGDVTGAAAGLFSGRLTQGMKNILSAAKSGNLNPLVRKAINDTPLGKTVLGWVDTIFPPPPEWSAASPSANTIRKMQFGGSKTSDLPLPPPRRSSGFKAPTESLVATPEESAIPSAGKVIKKPSVAGKMSYGGPADENFSTPPSNVSPGRKPSDFASDLTPPPTSDFPEGSQIKRNPKIAGKMKFSPGNEGPNVGVGGKNPITKKPRVDSGPEVGPSLTRPPGWKPEDTKPIPTVPEKPVSESAYSFPGLKEGEKATPAHYRQAARTVQTNALSRWIHNNYSNLPPEAMDDKFLSRVAGEAGVNPPKSAETKQELFTKLKVLRGLPKPPGSK